MTSTGSQKKQRRLRPPLTSDERIVQRDRKLFEREKKFAMSLGKDVMPCQCGKCMGDKARPFRTVERHLLKNGRYIWSRVFGLKFQTDSSDEEWEASARQQSSKQQPDCDPSYHENDVQSGGLSSFECGGHRPTGYAHVSSDEPKTAPGCSQHEEHVLPEQDTRFQDMIYDMFQRIDNDEDGFQEEFLGMIEEFADVDAVRALTTDHICPESIDNVEATLDDGFCQDPFAEFQDFFKPLYVGAKQSTLEFTVVLVNLCTEHRVPQVFINSLLCLLRRKSMPQPNNVPRNWYYAKKMIMTLGLEYVNIDACTHGHVLFRKEFANLQECPICHAARYKENSKVPVNRIRWFPLIPRLLRMYRCPSISLLMTWAFDHRTNGNVVHHTGDSKQWKFLDQLCPEYAKDPRFLHLALMLDGVNPFQVQSVKHSMWPFMIVNYNLPPWLSTKRFFVMLSILVSGRNSITQENVDVYCEPLYEELKELWEPGVKAFDPHARLGKQSFTLYGVLMWTINDYPALGYISGIQHGGNISCTVCGGALPAVRAKLLFKSVHLNHRRWLPEGHPWRTEAFAHRFNGLPEYEGPPPRQSAANIQERAAEKAEFDRLVGRGRKNVPGDPYELHGIKRRSALFDLPYWPHLPVRHCLDVMHLEKNFCENLLNFLLGIKDTKAVRDDMQSRGIRSELWAVPVERGKKNFDLPPAPYVFTESERDVFMKRLKRLKVPDGYCGSWVSKVELGDKPKDHRLFGLKSHDYHVLMQQILPVCIRGLLSDEVRQTIILLSSVFQRLCSKDFDPKSYPQLMSDTVLTLCRMEMHFPPAFFDPMTHLLIHAVEELEWCGPVHTRWMYFGERALAHLTRYSKSRANVARSIAACYVREEALGYLTEYMTGMDAYERRVWDKDEDLEVAGEVLKGKGTPMKLAEKELLDIHNYVLQNVPELERWRRSFADLRNSGMLSEGTEFGTWIQQEVPNHFLKHPGSDLDPLYLCRPPPMTAISYRHLWAYGSHYRARKTHDKPSAYYDSGVSGFFECSVQEGSDETVMVQYVGEVTDILHICYHTKQPVVIMRARWVRPPDPSRHPSFKHDLDGFLSANFKQLLPDDVDPYVFPKFVHQVFFLEHEAPQSGWRVVLKAEPRSKRMYEVDPEEEVLE